MRALVTGGGGFLGRYLVKRLLADGIEPISFSRRSHAELNDLGIEQRQGDLASFDEVDRAIQGVDAVFHVAAFPSIVMDPTPYYLTNLMGGEFEIQTDGDLFIAKIQFEILNNL